MNKTQRRWGWLMAAAGALLAGACAFIIALVLDFAPWLNALVTIIGAVIGAWYGMRLTGITVRRDTVESGSKHHSERRH